MTKPQLHLDFETASEVDLKKHGLDRYARHASTRVLMLGFAWCNSAPHLWCPHKGPMSDALRHMLEDPNVEIVAHNAEFERMILLHVLGIDVPLERFVCTQAMAASLALPLDLDRLTEDALQLPMQFRKSKEGKRLIDLFCKPNRVTKARPWKWNDWTTHPEDWARFCFYCQQDVISERHVHQVLLRYLPDLDEMRRLWVLCQKINERGVPVDLEIVRGAQRIADETKRVLFIKMQAISCLPNPNSPDQALAWLLERGYPYNNLRKERVVMALDKDIGVRPFLDDDAIEFLELRQLAAKTSVTKLARIEAVVSEDGRLRHMFQFRGAGRTGRYGGRTVQLQNLPRPHKDVVKWLAEARQILREGRYDVCAAFFDSPLDVVSSSIRSVISAPPGKKLVVADLAAIELAILAWLTNCKFWLDVLRKKLDPYKSFGVHFLSKPYDEITKSERTDCKPGALGAGYRLGGGFLSTDKNGDVIKTGLWGYAENMGITLTQAAAARAVEIYRVLSPEIESFWYDLERTVMECIKDKQPRVLRGLVIDVKAPFLRIRLPSGRRLHYLRPKIEKVRVRSGTDENGKPKYFDTINMTYEGLDQTTNQWVRQSTHGGKLTENIVQAIALDVLNGGIDEAEEEEFEVVLHVHDEIGTLCDEDDEEALPELIECMTRLRHKWMEGMPLAAAGYESEFYKKD